MKNIKKNLTIGSWTEAQMDRIHEQLGMSYAGIVAEAINQYYYNLKAKCLLKERISEKEMQRMCVRYLDPNGTDEQKEEYAKYIQKRLYERQIAKDGKK